MAPITAQTILIYGIKDYQHNGARIDEILSRVNVPKEHVNIIKMADLVANCGSDDSSILYCANEIVKLI